MRCNRSPLSFVLVFIHKIDDKANESFDIKRDVRNPFRFAINKLPELGGEPLLCEWCQIKIFFFIAV